MTPETLNIEYHTRRLCVKALNITGTVESAAYQLGITERTLYRYLKRFKIKREKRTNEWYYVELITEKQ